MGFSAAGPIPPGTPAGIARVHDNQEYPATYKFKVGMKAETRYAASRAARLARCPWPAAPAVAARSRVCQQRRGCGGDHLVH
jgi:hypothetical protein